MYVEVPWLMAGAMIFGAAIGLAILALLGTRDFGGRTLPGQGPRSAGAGDEAKPWMNGHDQTTLAPAEYDEREIEEPTAEITQAEMEQRMERAEAGLLKYVSRPGVSDGG